jgi:hypothetical protein
VVWLPEDDENTSSGMYWKELMRDYILPRAYNIKDLTLDYDSSGNPTWKAG